MQTFSTLKGQVIPLPLKDVDTDMIIPAQFLTQIKKTGYGEHLFERLREQDPDFVFNDPKFQQATILIAGPNFGCGSSREHAVWALLQHGIRVVLATSFSDIFFNNAAKNGLLLVTLAEETIASWSDEATTGRLMLTVDLNNQMVSSADGRKVSFSYDSFRKTCLLQGYDDLDYLLQAMPKIEAFMLKES